MRPPLVVPSPAGIGTLVAVGTWLAVGTLVPGSASAAIPAGPSPTPARGIDVVATADGALELRSGSTVVAKIPVVTPALRRGVPQVRALDVDRHHVAEVRIPVRGRPSEEVWIGDIGAKPAGTIWAGIVGPRDADEETAIFVEATPDRIFEYQTSVQVTRCDGEPVRLLARAWDFDSGRFRPILSTPPSAATQKLTARRGDPAMPAGRPLGAFQFTAASTTTGAGTDARALTSPAAVNDGDPTTVWAEGLGGDGRGEFLTARASAGHTRVRGLRIVPGDASTPAAFKAKNRIKSLALALGPEPERRFDVEFVEDPATLNGKNGKSAAAYWIALPVPIASDCITVAIRDVYRGTETGPKGGGGTTAISDLEVFTELDDPSGIEGLVSDMAKGTDCPSRVPLLVALGEPAVLPTAQAILGASGIGRECLVEALSRIDATVKSGVALDALAAALVGATANEERIIGRTLRKSSTPPVRAIATLLGSSNAAVDDRARAARVLGDLEGPDATAALLAAAGTDGGPEARLAIVQALGRSPAMTVPLLVAEVDRARATTGEAYVRREADLLRALPVVDRKTAGGQSAPAADAADRAANRVAARTATIAALRRSLASGKTFEVQARAVMAMGTVGDPGIVPDLVKIRGESNDAVLRFLAARELGGVGGGIALAALRTALEDADPRVRETAAQGLGFHRDTASEAALIQAAKDEPWPFARRAQVEALSRTCGTPARDLLARAMERDVDEVRRAALVGLVRCHDPRARPILLSTLKSRPASATLRELAAALLGEPDDADGNVTKDLADILASLVNEAEADLAIEGVAVSALRSLGQRGGPDAARAAARLAGDTRHPYRHIAVDALGNICDAGVGAKTLAAVRAGTDTALAAAAQAAQQHCDARVAPAPRGLSQ